MTKRNLNIRDAAFYARADISQLVDEIIQTQGFRNNEVFHDL